MARSSSTQEADIRIFGHSLAMLALFLPFLCNPCVLNTVKDTAENCNTKTFQLPIEENCNLLTSEHHLAFNCHSYVSSIKIYMHDFFNTIYMHD